MDIQEVDVGSSIFNTALVIDFPGTSVRLVEVESNVVLSLSYLFLHPYY